MTPQDVENGYLQEGDYFIDPLAEYEYPRRIIEIVIHDEVSGTVRMDDGGTVGLDEITEDRIRLESELNG